jgi:hypothetical protein
MSLIKLAEAGDTAGVLRELGALTPAERASRAGELAARAEAMLADKSVWGYTGEERTAQAAAELGCQVTPGTSAEWLVRDHPLYPDYGQLVEVTSLYSPDWRAELVERLGALAKDSQHEWLRLAEHIIQDTGCPVPATDGFISAWLADRSCPGSHWKLPGRTLLERLREDDLTPSLLPLAVARPGVRLVHLQTGAFLSLSADGLVDRSAVIRHMFADLVSAPPRLEDATDVVKALALTSAEHAAVSDDRARLVERLLETIRYNFMDRETGPAFALLRALAPTAAENARFAAKYLELLRRDWWSAAAPAAGYAQQALLKADEAGLLAAETFTTVVEQVPEASDWQGYRVAGLVSRLSLGRAIDRDGLIQRAFADLVGTAPYPGESAYLLTALALTPAEHAGVSDDRVRLLRPLLERLLEDDGRKDITASLAFLSALAPTVAENAGFAAQYVALLDRSSPVAGHAQEALLGLDQAGLLEPETFTEMCRRVLIRPEKKLVRAQLAGLDRAAGRDPARAARFMADAATAFQHPDPAIQEHALDLIARHLPTSADSMALPALRAAAQSLSPAFADRASELFGAPHDAPERFAEVLPAVPASRPVPAPLATAAEVAQEVAAVVAGDQDVAAFERALDGLVRHARSDRDALAEALKPVTRREPVNDLDCRQADLYDVARAVLGAEPREFAVQSRGGPFSLAGALLAARMTEAIEVIESGTQPFLLAVPTLATGALDAGVLALRLAKLEELGVTPAPVDLAQALLRVGPTDDPRVLRAAGELSSEAGRRLARWLHDGGLPHHDSEPGNWYRNESWEASRSVRPAAALASAFPAVVAALIGPDRERGLMEPPAPFWVAQLPHHRDELMAHDFAPGLSFHSVRRMTRILPFVAEAGGPAGFAVHRALAYGMARGAHGDDATVDALLVLTARGQLDSGLLGRLLETLLRARLIEANRVVASLRAAAETGAYGTTWAIIAAALPGLLGGAPVREAAMFLSLATECASRCGAKGEIAEVVALAGRRSSSQTVKNARLLRDALR